MTQQEKRIKIAEACGWTVFSLDVTTHFVRCIAKGPDGEWGLIPNYFNDLNDMHKAERILTLSEEQLYFETLHETAGNTMFYRAAASQRAEAFGKTLNLW
jgi:hypothetical protein